MAKGKTVKQIVAKIRSLQKQITKLKRQKKKAAKKKKSRRSRRKKR